MTQRIIEGALRWATSCPKPTFAPQAKPSPAKRKGIAFEARVAATLGIGRHGDWFNYADDKGLGYCQPDLWWKEPAVGNAIARIVVVEVKLTWTLAASRAILGLYAPVLSHIHQLPVHGIIICKNLTPLTPRGAIFGDLREALAHTGPRTPTICHWPGKFPGALKA
jgi:hypothetical protein